MLSSNDLKTARYTSPLRDLFLYELPLNCHNLTGELASAQFTVLPHMAGDSEHLGKYLLKIRRLSVFGVKKHVTQWNREPG